MTINFKELAIGLTNQAVPLVTKGLGILVENRSIEKRTILQDQKIEKFEESLTRLSKDKTEPGSKNTSSKQKLTTGILPGEDKAALGNRKWKEYEDHLSNLPDDATPGQVQLALQEIQVNMSESYPCEDCRQHAIENLGKFPLTNSDTKTKSDAKQRLCGFHNVVNKMLEKPITVDCTRIKI